MFKLHRHRSMYYDVQVIVLAFDTLVCQCIHGKSYRSRGP